MQSNNPFGDATDEKAPLPNYYSPPPGAPPANPNGPSYERHPNGELGNIHHPEKSQAYPPGPYEGATLHETSAAHSLPSYSEAFHHDAPRQPSRPYVSQPYITHGAHPSTVAGSSGTGSARAATQGILSHSRNPLDPPPPSFSRPVATHLLHVSNATQFPGFPPMRLYSNEPALDKGFPILLPSCPVQPHPFAQRDVMEGDWVRFLQDLQLTGRLGGGQRVAANLLPVAMGIGLVGGLFVTKAIEKGMKGRKKEPVAELVDTWNQHFFHNRRLHVILAHGSENLSGDVDGPAPDWQEHQSRSSTFSSSSSDSSSDDKHHHGHHDGLVGRIVGPRQDRRAERGERKQERRERKHERGEGRNRKGSRKMKHEKYRLVIVSF